MMNTLILAFRILKKRWLSMLLLTIEMIIVLFVAVGVLSKASYIKNNEKILNVFNNENVIYFHPELYYSENFKVENVLSKEQKDNVVIGKVEQIRVELNDGKYINCIGYNDMILDAVNWNIKSGQVFDYKEEGYIQAISVGYRYEPNDIVELPTGDKIKIIATMDRYEYVISCSAGASSGDANLEAFISVPSAPALIVPEGSERYTNLPREVIDEQTVGGSAKFIKINDEKYERQIIDKLKEYGPVSKINEMEENYHKENVQFFISNGIVLVVSAVLFSVGIAGVNAIQSEKNSRDYAIYYICGMNPKKNMLIEFINTFIMAAITYAGFRIVLNLAGDIILGDEIAYKEYMSGGVIVIIAVIYFISSIFFIIKAKVTNLAILYKRG